MPDHRLSTTSSSLRTAFRLICKKRIGKILIHKIVFFIQIKKRTSFVSFASRIDRLIPAPFLEGKASLRLLSEALKAGRIWDEASNGSFFQLLPRIPRANREASREASKHGMHGNKVLNLGTTFSTNLSSRSEISPSKSSKDELIINDIKDSFQFWSKRTRRSKRS